MLAIIIKITVPVLCIYFLVFFLIRSYRKQEILIGEKKVNGIEAKKKILLGVFICAFILFISLIFIVFK